MDTNDSTRILKRFTRGDWRRRGESLTMSITTRVTRSMYIRVRGTSTNQMEPMPDVLGEDPWQDLWFYSNPAFIELPSPQP